MVERMHTLSPEDAPLLRLKAQRYCKHHIEWNPSSKIFEVLRNTKRPTGMKIIR